MRAGPDLDAETEAAIADLQAILAQKYPDAEFSTYYRDDPGGWRLGVTVDIEDTDEVLDLVMDRLYEYQVQRELPVYVMPHWPRHRIAKWVATDPAVAPPNGQTAADTPCHVTIEDGGVIRLPEAIRAQYGFTPGEELLLYDAGGGLVLRRVRDDVVATPPETPNGQPPSVTAAGKRRAPRRARTGGRT